MSERNRSSSKISVSTSAELKCTTALVTSTEGSLNRMNLRQGEEEGEEGNRQEEGEGGVCYIGCSRGRK